MVSIPPIYGDLGMVYDCFTHINEDNNGNNNNANGKLMVNIPHFVFTHINIATDSSKCVEIDQLLKGISNCSQRIIDMALTRNSFHTEGP